MITYSVVKTKKSEVHESEKYSRKHRGYYKTVWFVEYTITNLETNKSFKKRAGYFQEWKKAAKKNGHVVMETKAGE